MAHLSDEFVRGFDVWSKDVGLLSPTRTRSTLMALSHHEELSITELARVLQQSHPLVITWVRQLRDLGLVISTSDPNDARRTLLALTPEGRAEIVRMKESDHRASEAYRTLLRESGTDERLLEVLWRIEKACRAQSFGERLYATGQPDDLAD